MSVSPAQVLYVMLVKLGIPVESLSGGPTVLHVEFGPEVTAAERKAAFEVIAGWDWNWEKYNDGRRGR